MVNWNNIRKGESKIMIFFSSLDHGNPCLNQGKKQTVFPSFKTDIQKDDWR